MVELAKFGDLVLLDVCCVCSAQDLAATEAGARTLGLPITRVLDAVLAGIKGELSRRWRGETGPSRGVELPNFNVIETVQVRDVLAGIDEYYRRRLGRAGPNSALAPTFEEALRLTGALIAALPEAATSMRAVN